MATAEAETSQGERGASGGLVYDGFISYSHAADDLLAPRLQSGLQRFAKPWWKRRALRIFRDEASLSANPHLWSSITDALDKSDWFVLLLSPEAAESPWVNNEVEYWLANKDADKIIPVLSDGDFTWFDDDFISDAAPSALQGAFSDEPRWVDLRFARTEEQLDLKNPTFSAAVADIASPIRGVPKDELESEEVRQHRRTVRTAWGAGVVVVALAIAAGSSALFANAQRADADSQRAAAESATAAETEQRLIAEEKTAEAENAREAESQQRIAAEQSADEARAEALASQAVVQLERDPELSVLLALEALETDSQPSAVSALHAALQSHRTVYTHPGPIDEFYEAAISPDGSLLAVGLESGVLELWDTATGQLLSSFALLDEGLASGILDFTADGSHVVWLDSTRTAQYSRGEGLLFVAVADGAVTRIVDPGECIISIEPSGNRYVDPQGKVATQWGIANEAGAAAACDITTRRVGYIDLATEERTVVTEVAGDIAEVGGPSMSDDGSLFAVGIDSPVTVYDTASGEVVREFDVTGISTLSPDGSRILVGQSPVELRRIDDGGLMTVYQGNFSDAFFSPDESFVYAADFDGSIKLFDTNTGTIQRELRGPSNRSVDPMLSADASRLLGGVPLNTIWDVGSGALTESPAFDLNLPPGSRVVPTAGVNVGGDLIHLPFQTGLALQYQILDRHGLLIRESGPVGWSAMSKDGRYVAELPGTLNVETPSGSPGEFIGKLQLVDARTGDVVLVFEDACEFYFDPVSFGTEAAPNCEDYLAPSDLEFSGDSSTLAARGFGWNSAVFDVESGDRIWSEGVAEGLPPLQFATGISPDGSVVFSVGVDDFTYQYIDTASGDVLGATPAREGFNEVVFSSTGSHVFIADWLANIIVVETDTWTETAILSRAQGGSLADVSVSPDDRLAASVGIDGVVRVWDWANETVVDEIDLGIDVNHIEFIDQDHLLVVSRAGEVLVLTLDEAELMLIARDRVTRGFTPEECATYSIDPCPTLEEIRSGSA